MLRITRSAAGAGLVTGLVHGVRHMGACSVTRGASACKCHVNCAMWDDGVDGVLLCSLLLSYCVFASWSRFHAAFVLVQYGLCLWIPPAWDLLYCVKYSVYLANLIFNRLHVGEGRDDTNNIGLPLRHRMVIGHGSATTRPRERSSVSPRGRVAEGDAGRLAARLRRSFSQHRLSQKAGAGKSRALWSSTRAGRRFSREETSRRLSVTR